MVSSDLDNISFLLSGARDAKFAQRPIPKLSPYDVLVAVKKTGICGSDVHFYSEGKMVDNVVTTPFSLGHESAGVISKVGEKVKNVKVGDRVAMEPGESCYRCEDCKAGRYQFCEFCEFASNHPVDGTLQRYFKLPADMVYKLPDNITLEEGALVEPLSVAVHTVSTLARLRANQKVAVFGAGPIGLACMAVSRALGASRIIAIDIVPSRLKFAKGYVGADTFLPPRIEDGESKVQYSRRMVKLMSDSLRIEERGVNGIDLVVDATGAETCAQMAIFLAKEGGKFIQVGFGAQEVILPITLLLTKELTVRGSWRYGPGDYELAIALIASGKVDMKPLVTHRFKFQDAIAAFEATRKGMGSDGRSVIKTIISGPDVLPEEH